MRVALTAALAGVLDHLECGGVAGTVVYNHVCTGFAQRDGDGLADAAIGTGHKCFLAL